MEKRSIRMSEIQPGEVIPLDVDIINDYPTVFMKEVIENSTNQYLRASKKADTAKVIATAALTLSGIALGIAVSVLIFMAVIL